MSTSTSSARWGIEFPENVVAASQGRVNILALSGGGYRGLFGASVLASLESRFESAVRDKFHLLAGTSIGGIVACALAAGVPAATVHLAFRAHGKEIFPPGNFARRMRGFWHAQYATEPLKKVIGGILGEHADIMLKDIRTPLLLPTVCVNDSGPLLLKSGGLGDDEISRDLTLLDAALATSAAPTYFPSRTIKSRTVVDGGLVANAPEAVAMTEAIRSFAVLADLHVLSVGTCGSAMRKKLGESVEAGKIGWLLRHGLIELTLDAQEQLAVEMMATLLGDRYLRIDADPSAEERRLLGLDKANEAATRTLEDLAMRALEKTQRERSQQLGDFFC